MNISLESNRLQYLLQLVGFELQTMILCAISFIFMTVNVKIELFWQSVLSYSTMDSDDNYGKKEEMSRL